MIAGAQIKAARTLLGWSVPDLARRTGIDISGIQELESAAKMPNRRRNDLALVQTILEEAGIAFIDSVGVRLRPMEVPGP
jgi:transcriptional regulator with XRE-family HTH domain